MKHKKPLAIGWSTMTGPEMAEANKGKGIRRCTGLAMSSENGITTQVFY